MSVPLGYLVGKHMKKELRIIYLVLMWNLDTINMKKT